MRCGEGGALAACTPYMLLCTNGRAARALAHSELERADVSVSELWGLPLCHLHAGRDMTSVNYLLLGLALFQFPFAFYLGVRP